MREDFNPTWQGGDELVDVLDVPLTGVCGDQAVGTGGPLWQRRRRLLVSRQIRTLAGLRLLGRKWRVACGWSGGRGGWRFLRGRREGGGVRLAFKTKAKDPPRSALTFFLGSTVQFFRAAFRALCLLMFSNEVFLLGKRPILLVQPTL